MILLTTTDGKCLWVNGINVNAVQQQAKTSRIYMIGGYNISVKEDVHAIVNMIDTDMEEK